MPMRPRSSLFVLPLLIIVGFAVAAPIGSRRSVVESSAAQSTVAAFDVMEKSIEGLQSAMEAKQITSRKLVDLYLARIGA